MFILALGLGFQSMSSCLQGRKTWQKAWWMEAARLLAAEAERREGLWRRHSLQRPPPGHTSSNQTYLLPARVATIHQWTHPPGTVAPRDPVTFQKSRLWLRGHFRAKPWYPDNGKVPILQSKLFLLWRKLHSIRYRDPFISPHRAGSSVRVCVGGGGVEWSPQSCIY